MKDGRYEKPAQFNFSTRQDESIFEQNFKKSIVN